MEQIYIPSWYKYPKDHHLSNTTLNNENLHMICSQNIQAVSFLSNNFNLVAQDQKSQTIM